MRLRRRYQFRRGGMIFILVTLLVSLGAFNSQNNLLFWAFGVGLALLIVSGVVSGSMLMGVDVRREALPTAAAGGTVVLRYRVRNTSKRTPAFALTLRDRLDGDGASRVGPIVAFVPHVPAGGEVVVRATAVVRRRGPVRLQAVDLVSSFPFGMFGKVVRFDQPATLLVRPSPVEVPASLVRDVRGAAERSRNRAASGRRGEGDEFHALREFSPSDPVRRIAWRASARRDALLVRQNEAPRPTRVRLVLRLEGWTPSEAAESRAGPTPPPEDPHEEAIAWAAALADMLVTRGYEVGLDVPTHSLVVPPGATPRSRAALLDALASLEPAEPERTAQTAGPAASGKSAAAIVEVAPRDWKGTPTPNAIAVRPHPVHTAGEHSHARTARRGTKGRTTGTARPKGAPA